MGSRLGAVVLASFTLSLGLVSTSTAEPIRAVVPGNVPVRQVEPQALAPYNTVYLNRCGPSGCTVNYGASSSKTNSFYTEGGQRVLSAFPYGDDAWNKVVGCIRDVFSPFMVNIVTTNPGGADHWEIMIAGDPLELDSTWVNYGGVAPGDGICNGVIDNALVFAFAKAYGNNTTNECDDRCVNEICSTAAQEVGHTWRKMDHVRVASDPMTYFNYSYRRYFQNMAAQCGSDCGSDGKAPSGQTCYGTGNESHTCWCTGETQNSYNIVKDLFGLGPGTPPITKITRPMLGDSVEQGFVVETDISDDSGSVPRVEFKVDGTLVTTLTTQPFVFNAPGGLEEGPHHVEVIAYDPHGVAGTASVDVIIGPPCKSESDCSREDDVCVGGRCVPGPNATGGLGTTCTDSSLCASRACASDGSVMYCVEACRVGDCPDGFGCLDTGAGDGTGVCWPGYDDGSGGCGCQTSRGGPAGMVFALLVMVLTCRRRRR